MIRHVLFDLDDTLLDFHKAEREALIQTLRHVGVEPREEVLRRYSAINRRQWERLETGEITREEVKVGRYHLLFEEIGVSVSPVDATRYYEGRLAAQHFLLDGAVELLDALHGQYRLYVVTNGTARVQRRRMADAGIPAYMDGIFISEDIGHDKPDKAFFDCCFAAIPDFRREETVIVGDSLTSDMRGGRNAGIATVWFHPAADGADDAGLSDYTIRQLSDLPNLLRTI